MTILNIAVLLVMAYGAKVIGVALVDAVESFQARRAARRCGRSIMQTAALRGFRERVLKPKHIRRVGGF